MVPASWRMVGKTFRFLHHQSHLPRFYFCPQCYSWTFFTTSLKRSKKDPKIQNPIFLAIETARKKYNALNVLRYELHPKISCKTDVKSYCYILVGFSEVKSNAFLVGIWSDFFLLLAKFDLILLSLAKFDLISRLSIQLDLSNQSLV